MTSTAAAADIATARRLAAHPRATELHVYIQSPHSDSALPPMTLADALRLYADHRDYDGPHNYAARVLVGTEPVWQPNPDHPSGGTIDTEWAAQQPHILDYARRVLGED